MFYCSIVKKKHYTILELNYKIFNYTKLNYGILSYLIFYYVIAN